MQFGILGPAECYSESDMCLTHTQLSVGHVEHEKSIVLSYSLYDTL